MAASLNLSLTHRDHAQSVRFITGHAKNGSMPEMPDWKGLADSATTLVIYMGGRTGAAMARRLIAEGMAAGTPCVVARSVSRAGQTANFGSLADLASGALATAGDEPVLIGIGDALAEARTALPAELWPALTRQFA